MLYQTIGIFLIKLAVVVFPDEALKVVSGSSAIAARVSSDHLTAGCTAYNSEAQSQSQSESRIRVRDWLMLADQSILQKTIDQQPGISAFTYLCTCTCVFYRTFGYIFVCHFPIYLIYICIMRTYIHTNTNLCISITYL